MPGIKGIESQFVSYSHALFTDWTVYLCVCVRVRVGVGVCVCVIPFQDSIKPVDCINYLCVSSVLSFLFCVFKAPKIK